MQNPPSTKIKSFAEIGKALGYEDCFIGIDNSTRQKLEMFGKKYFAGEGWNWDQLLNSLLDLSSQHPAVNNGKVNQVES